MSEQDQFIAHEVLHTVSILSETFDRFISDHPFVTANVKLRDRAENISGLLGEFYQVAAEYSVGGDPDGRRPRFEKSVAARGPAATRILNAIKKQGGLTELQLAKKLYGRDAVQQNVNADCRLLVKKGLVERRGAGGRGDPFTYYLAE